MLKLKNEGFKTHRVTSQGRNESKLLNMFTTFLSSEKKILKQNQNSSKNMEINKKNMNTNLLEELEKQTHQNEEEIIGEKPEIEDFNIFKVETDKKTERKIPGKAADPFNLCDLNSDIFSFDRQKLNAKASFKKIDSITEEDHRNTASE